MVLNRKAVLSGLCLLVLVLAGHRVFADKTTPADREIPYEAIKNFTEVFGRVKASYVEPVDDQELLKNAIRGMLSGLDPHSTYLDPKDFTELQESTAGEFGGLGIEVTMEGGFVKVVAPMDDTPAARAGVLAGDLIIRIDDKPVKGMDLSEAVSLMRGKPGTDIELTIMRENADAPLTLTMQRAVIKVHSVRSRLLEPGYAYLRIATFQTRTGADVLSHLDKLKAENKTPLRGLVLDLRNNPGGVLSAAVDVADAFLDTGLIVYTKGRGDEPEFKQNATPGDALNGAPIVVLINAGSASASEIVAGALQDHVRAILMGFSSFGKGSVQTILELNNGHAIKLTTARYFTPKGRSIQAEGIVPDIKLSRARLELLDKESGLTPVKEANLSKHLRNPDSKDGKQADKKPGKEKETAKSDEKAEELAAEDYELFEALNLLKGLTILQSRSN